MRILLLLLSSYLSATIPTHAASDALPQLAAGHYHTCLLRDGEVHCWGDNTFGQAQAPKLEQPTQIAAGGNLSCAIDQKAVVCWGGTNSIPLTPPPLIDPVHIAISHRGDSACALDQGRLVCWGAIPENFFHSELPGLSDLSDFSIGKEIVCTIAAEQVNCVRFAAPHTLDPLPQPAPYPHALTLVKPQKIVVGDGQVCAQGAYSTQCQYLGSDYVFRPLKSATFSLDVNGNGCGLSKPDYLTCWPEGSLRGTLTRARAVALGAHHLCLASDEQIACWGENAMGQLDYAVKPEQEGQPGEIHIEPTPHPSRINITFPDARGAALWENKREYGDPSATFVRLPEEDQSTQLLNLADTGCVVEQKIATTPEDLVSPQIYRLAAHPDTDCSNPRNGFYAKDVSAAVQMQQSDAGIVVTINDPQTLGNYLSESGSLNISSPQITRSARFIAFTPKGSSQPIIRYATEFLLLDLQTQKAWRIATPSAAARAPEILAYQNKFLFSYSQPGGESAFGKLSLFDPETWISRPIEGWQGRACGTASLSLVRDRLQSHTDSYMACSGGRPHTHQGKFIAPYEIQLTYSDYAKNEGGDAEVESYIEELFKPADFVSVSGQRLQITGRYIYSTDNQQLTLTPLETQYQWPIPLVQQPEDEHPDAPSVVGQFDGWIEFGVLHLQLEVDKQAAIDDIRLALRVALIDAADTSRARTKGKQEHWEVGFTLSGTPLTVALDDSNALRKSGLSPEVVNRLESNVVALQSEKTINGKAHYHLTFDMAAFPVRSIHDGTTLQVQLRNSANPDSAATLDPRHVTAKNGWYGFSPLSARLAAGWGEEILPRSLVTGSFTHALQVDGGLYLAAPDTQHFRPYASPAPDEQWLQQHRLFSLRPEETAQLVTTHEIRKVFYTVTDDITRAIVFFYQPGHPGNENVSVIDYDANGNLLRSSRPYPYFEYCYRYCDEEDAPQPENFSAYQLDTREIIIFTGAEYWVFDPKSFQWASAVGNLTDLIEIFSAGDSDAYSFIDTNYFPENLLNFYTLSPIGEHQLQFRSNVFTEPLTGIGFRDPNLQKCVSSTMVNAIVLNPGATREDIKSLVCDEQITQLEGVEALRQLTSVDLYLKKSTSLQRLATLPNLTNVSLQGDDIDLAWLADKPLERLSLIGENIDLSPLAGSHIRHLHLRSNDVPLTALSDVQSLQKLDLDSSLLLPVTDETLLRHKFSEVEELIHRKSGEVPLLRYFPKLKRASLFKILNEECPASTTIEALELAGPPLPLQAACYPDLQDFRSTQQGNIYDCGKELFKGNGFEKLTNLQLSCFDKHVFEKLPSVTNLTASHLTTPIGAQVKFLDLGDMSCPDDSLLTAAHHLTLRCLMHGEQRNFTSRLTAEFQLTKAETGDSMSLANSSLTAKIYNNDPFPKLFTASRGYRALNLEKVEKLDVEVHGRTPIWEAIEQMPALKNLRLRNHRESEPEFVFRLPELASLEHLEIQGFKKIDLSYLEPSSLVSLRVNAYEDPFVSPIRWQQFHKLHQLELPPKYPVFLENLPCNLKRLNAWVNPTAAAETQSCSNFEEVVFKGELRDLHGLQHQLAGVIKRDNQSTDYYSVLWNEDDKNEFLKGREFQSAQLASLEQLNRASGINTIFERGGMIRASLYLRELGISVD